MHEQVRIFSLSRSHQAALLCLHHIMHAWPQDEEDDVDDHEEDDDDVNFDA